MQTLRVRPESSCGIAIPGDPSEHEPDARQPDEGDGRPVEVFVVLGQTPAAVDPGDGALDNPAPGDDLETLGLCGALDHLDPPGGIGHGPAQLLARRAWPAGSAVRSRPIPHPSNRSDNEDPCARRDHGSHASTSGTS